MTLYLDDGDVRLYHGDALEQLALMPSESVQCIVTSPPFWGLRDYGTSSWEGSSDPDCDHLKTPHGRASSGLRNDGRAHTGPYEGEKATRTGTPYTDVCGKCGGRRVDQQIGLEETPELWCARLVAVMREARRVLRSDGVCFLECGDTYAGGGRGGNEGGTITGTPPQGAGNAYPRSLASAGIKAKDLVGAPWLLAFALRQDGWCLRSDVIWKRPNPMPESVTDRPTKAHSYIFMLTKARWAGAEPGRFADLPEGDKRWLAAIIDGEGSIAIKRHERADTGNISFGAQVTIINTNAALLAEVRRIVGDVGSMSTKAGVNHPVTAWSTANTIARDVLLAVYPYLIAKRDQARIAIHLQSLLYHRGMPTKEGARRTPAELGELERLHKALKAANQAQPQDLAWVPEPKYGRWIPERYFYDADAIREADAGLPSGNGFNGRQGGSRQTAVDGGEGTAERFTPGAGRNARSVWSIPTEPTPFAHFATFPQALVERCIKSGTSEYGACSECGAPWRRVLSERAPLPFKDTRTPGEHTATGNGKISGQAAQDWLDANPRTTRGWEASCDHDAPVRPCLVADPFMGSGTTALVARRLGRHAIGIELNAEYLAIAGTRLSQLSLLA